MMEEDVNMEWTLIDPDCDVVGIEDVVEAVVDAFADVVEGEGAEPLVHHQVPIDLPFLPTYLAKQQLAVG
jgi:hypothetical protein